MLEKSRNLALVLIFSILVCVSGVYAAGVNFLTPKLLDLNLSKFALSSTSCADSDKCGGSCVCSDGTNVVEFRGALNNVPLLNHRLSGQDNVLSLNFDTKQNRQICNVNMPPIIDAIISSPSSANIAAGTSIIDAISSFVASVARLTGYSVLSTARFAESQVKIDVMAVAIASAKLAGLSVDVSTALDEAARDVINAQQKNEDFLDSINSTKEALSSLDVNNPSDAAVVAASALSDFFTKINDGASLDIAATGAFVAANHNALLLKQRILATDLLASAANQATDVAIESIKKSNEALSDFFDAVSNAVDSLSTLASAGADSTASAGGI